MCVGMFLFGALRRGHGGASLYIFVLVFWGVRAGRCEFGRVWSSLNFTTFCDTLHHFATFGNI